jgi:hypothetical protein
VYGRGGFMVWRALPSDMVLSSMWPGRKVGTYMEWRGGVEFAIMIARRVGDGQVGNVASLVLLLYKLINIDRLTFPLLICYLPDYL